MLKGRTKTYQSLTEIINLRYRTDFQLAQIKYQVKKLMEANFGKPQDDAYRFVELARNEAENGGFFRSEVNREREFYRCIFLSKVMLLYSLYFIDIVIIDSTYKRNRFNLPLVNVIGVNNYGHSIMLAFGLLSEETTESYTWFFSKLKRAWENRQPQNFIIDGCVAMKQGIYFINPIIFKKHRQDLCFQLYIDNAV